jgi:hypothetical protein
MLLNGDSQESALFWKQDLYLAPLLVKLPLFYVQTDQEVI